MGLLVAIADNAKAIGAVVTCCTGIGTGYVFLDGPIPASKAFVIAETQSVKRDMIDSRLETNDVRRHLLRKEKLDRTLDLEKEHPANVRAIIRDRLEWIEAELDMLNKARDDLRKERGLR